MTRVLALDVGTSSVRARIYDERGRLRHGEEAQTRYDVTHGRGGRAELDADHIFEAARAALERGRQGGAGDANARRGFRPGPPPPRGRRPAAAPPPGLPGTPPA